MKTIALDDGTVAFQLDAATMKTIKETQQLFDIFNELNAEQDRLHKEYAEHKQIDPLKTDDAQAYLENSREHIRLFSAYCDAEKYNRLKRVKSEANQKLFDAVSLLMKEFGIERPKDL